MTVTAFSIHLSHTRNTEQITMMTIVMPHKRQARVRSPELPTDIVLLQKSEYLPWEFDVLCIVFLRLNLISYNFKIWYLIFSFQTTDCVLNFLNVGFLLHMCYFIECLICEKEIIKSMLTKDLFFVFLSLTLI